MTLTHDADYWREQTDRATEIRPTLERLFYRYYSDGLVQPTETGTWQYTGKAEALIYDPISDLFRSVANDGSWQVNYHEQAFVPQANTEIRDDQLQTCRENKTLLDQLQIPQSPNLRSLVSVSSIEQAGILNTAATIFEQCAEAGMSADRSGSEWIYTVTVDDHSYLVSRDDAIGEYNVRNSEGTLDAQQSLGLSQRDVQTWKKMDQFFAERPIETSINTSDWTQTVWDRQCDRANSILSAMETVIGHGQNVEFDGSEYRVEPLEGYAYGYCPDTETHRLNRGNQRILTASNREAHYDSNTASWLLGGLEDIGSLTAEEANYFESLQLWLVIADQQFRKAQITEKSETQSIDSDLTLSSEGFAVTQGNHTLPTETQAGFHVEPNSLSEVISPPEIDER